MSLLKIIDNPDNDIALVTVLRSPIVGLTDNQLVEIRVTNKNVSFFEALILAKENEILESVGKILPEITETKKFQDETSSKRAELYDELTEINNNLYSYPEDEKSIWEYKRESVKTEIGKIEDKISKRRESTEIKIKNVINDVKLELKKIDKAINDKESGIKLYRENIRMAIINEENKLKVPDDFWSEFNIFSKKYCGDVNYPLYIDKSEDYLQLDEAIKLVKDAGGLVFLPHIFIYKWAEDKKKLLDDIVAEYDIDGIECMHSEFSQDDIDYLLEYTQKNNFYRSGGSDYHGKNKVGIEMAVGKGNLKIESYLIQDWVNK